MNATILSQLEPMLVWLLLVLAVLNVFALVWLLIRRADKEATETTINSKTEVLGAVVTSTERLERELRREITESSRGGRQELTQSFGAFQQALVTQSGEAFRTQNSQMDAFTAQSSQQLATVTQQIVGLQKSIADTLNTQLQGLSDANARRLSEVRETLEKQLLQLQSTNATKLDEMRQTVDEKLQSTLQARLGESFKQVADRLEQVHKGLGEMQTLAQGVGDLKHLLTNVKTRGIFGEAQLASLLEQVFTVDQYAAQVSCKPGSKNVVDFAVKLPGRSAEGTPLWLPIDAKFPSDDYERLLTAQANADPASADLAAKALEQRIRMEAKSIAEKYIEPPYTTDFAFLFLPSEGLYAEVLRRPGLMDSIQRDYRVNLAGPTTLLAMLSSLQMGFRTLALEKRSSEVWQVLGAVKTEFGKFGGMLDKARSQTETVLKTLSESDVRTRAMNRALKHVEALPENETQRIMPSLQDLEDAKSEDG